MNIKDQEVWDSWVANNQDPYGSAIIRYAEAWANLMEAHMADGEALADCAEATSHAANTEGISGFMYGAAVATLSSSWEHGEELRRWHNLDTQIGDEGEKANESGGVLNPAVLGLGE